MSDSQRLEPPRLRWDDGAAINREYGDGYFSLDDGLAESQHVFIQHNHLPRRLNSARRFCIGELGFGTGLNFLLSARLFEQHAPTGACLDYIAVEAAPMNAGQMRQALAPWPELAEACARLGQRLPDPHPGFHVIDFAPGIRLILLYGDVADMLPRCRAQVDAWFLDGFAPSRNPAMWSEDVMQQLARLSANGASFATYSAAGSVRRALQQAGFSVRKVTGFGRKRDMLAGEIRQPPGDWRQPWFLYPQTHSAEDIAILGDGIVGACLARQLAEDGRRVLVVGGRDGASHRIPGFLIRRYPEAAPGPRDSLYDQAFEQAQAFYAAYAPDAVRPVTLRTRHDDSQAALVLASAAATQALLDHPHIAYWRNSARPGIAPEEQGWRLSWADQNLHVGQLILCCAELPPDLEALLALPTAPCSGQAITVDGQLASAYAGDLHAFALDRRSQIGSSYRRDQRSLAPSQRETDRLLAGADRLGLTADLDCSSAQIHTGLRISSPDHLPLIGPAPDQAAWRRDYADLHHGRPEAGYPAGRCLPGLWLNLAHGSRGATLAPLAGLLLASAVQNRPLPLPTDLLGATHPGRFLLRALRRGQTAAS